LRNHIGYLSVFHQHCERSDGCRENNASRGVGFHRHSPRLQQGLVSANSGRDTTAQLIASLVSYQRVEMLDFHVHLEFDKRSAWESGNPDGGPDVATGFTKNFHEDVGCAVDDFWRVGKTGDGVYVAVDADDRLNQVE